MINHDLTSLRLYDKQLNANAANENDFQTLTKSFE